MPIRHCGLFIGVAALAVLTPARCFAAQACGGEALSSGVVRSVIDARTLSLDDGRTVLLDGIDIPSPAVSAETSVATQRAADALRTQLLGQPIRLSGRNAAEDRHGRLRAFVFADATGLEASVQHDMLRRGLARFAADTVGAVCAAELLGRELEARAARRGVWADPANAVRRADDPAAILALRGQMAVVEGRVLSVRESGSTIYVNFGRRWSEDFTVTIAKRSERRFAASGLPPQRLDRRQVRVRGWVEERGGPWIEVTRPEQIELVEPE